MDEPINFKDILRTIEAGFGKNLRTTEARFDFTGPYKKKSVYRCRRFDTSILVRTTEYQLGYETAPFTLFFFYKDQ